MVGLSDELDILLISTAEEGAVVADGWLARAFVGESQDDEQRRKEGCPYLFILNPAAIRC